ncbi:MAG: hypothetical protein ACAI34_13520 [Verrucomicrobium sp.]|nr:hypothetical protein [Verrucomicrobium sp.]
MAEDILLTPDSQPPLCPSTGQRWVYLAGVPLMVLALLGLAQSLLGLPFRTVVPLPVKDMRDAGQGAYSLVGPLRTYLGREVHASVHLREDALVNFGAESSSQQVRQAKGLAFAIGSKQGWLRASDGSDPRTNGREYEMVFPWLPPRWLAVLCWGVLAGVPILWMAAQAVRLWLLLRNWGRRMAQRGFPAGQRGPSAERVLLGGLLLLFFVPGSLSLGLHFFGHRLPPLPWLRNATLKGVLPKVKQPDVALTPGTLTSGAWQKQTATVFDTTFPGREAFIRGTGELWYRAFHRTALESTSIVMGKGGNLVERGYLHEYALKRTTSEALTPYVQELRRIQDACRASGLGFVYFITPSKAATQPELMPPHWQSRQDPRPRAYDQVLPLLQQHGVEYVDGAALTRQAVATAPAPVFPLGGVHWAPHAAYSATQQVVVRLQAQGVPVRPLELDQLNVVPEPLLFTEEDDLLQLLNVALPWRYPVVDLHVRPAPPDPAPRLRVVVIGGSFGYKVCRQLQECGQFKEIEIWFYYKHDRVRFRPGQPLAIVPAAKMDFERDLFSADVLLMEANEQILHPDGPNNHRVFYNELSEHLAKKEPQK